MTVPQGLFAAAASAPLVQFGDSAGEHRSVGFDALPGHNEAVLVDAAEGRQIQAGETRRQGSVVHAVVFRMGSVRTSILGRHRPLSQDHNAITHYTLNCKEPTIWQILLLRTNRGKARVVVMESDDGSIRPQKSSCCGKPPSIQPVLH